MRIFTHEFTNFLKLVVWCSWHGHQSSEWRDVWWAIGHSAGYQSKFCEICHKELQTTRRKNDQFLDHDINKK